VWVRDHTPFLYAHREYHENTEGGLMVRDIHRFASNAIATHRWAWPWSDHWNKEARYRSKEFRDFANLLSPFFSSYVEVDIYTEMYAALSDLSIERYCALNGRNTLEASELGVGHVYDQFVSAVRGAANKLANANLWSHTDMRTFTNTFLVFAQQMLTRQLFETVTKPRFDKPVFQ
jgi:hypothetical protein